MFDNCAVICASKSCSRVDTCAGRKYQDMKVTTEIDIVGELRTVAIATWDPGKGCLSMEVQDRHFHAFTSKADTPGLP